MKRTRTKENYKIWIGVLALLVLLLAVTQGMLYYYTTQLSLVLKGPEKITIGLNGVYDEQGVEAKLSGRDVSDDVKISGTVDPSTPGTYTLTYRSKTLTVKRQVIVGNTMEPVLQLNGTEHLSVKLGEDFEEPGYTAYDKQGNDLTSQVQVSAVDLKRAGEQKITYTVSDGEGNTTQIARAVTVEPNTEYRTSGLPICMYHYVYDENDPPADLHDRFNNYISAQALEEELNWLNSEGYYYPTWKEVRDYVDGKLLLPEKSIVLCFDDGSKSFLEHGIPVLEKCKVPATSFMITSSKGKEKIANYQSDYVNYESHSHNMHRPGGNIGHGGIFTAIAYDAGMADLKKSIDICGSSDALAYPYGDYNDSCIKMAEDAGFLCAVTTAPGRAKPGQNPLLLPRVRMVLGQTLDHFQYMVSPR